MKYIKPFNESIKFPEIDDMYTRHNQLKVNKDNIQEEINDIEHRLIKTQDEYISKIETILNKVVEHFRMNVTSNKGIMIIKTQNDIIRHDTKENDDVFNLSNLVDNFKFKTAYPDNPIEVTQEEYVLYDIFVERSIKDGNNGNTNVFYLIPTYDENELHLHLTYIHVKDLMKLYERLVKNISGNMLMKINN